MIKFELLSLRIVTSLDCFFTGKLQTNSAGLNLYTTIQEMTNRTYIENL